MKFKITNIGQIALQPTRILYIGLIIMILASLEAKGQEIDTDTLVSAEYPFINYEADTLINAMYLQPFFNKLLKLENGDSSQVNILHIGDSHIQADFLTSEVRKNFQLRFGNAGRGLVFPFKVAGFNEPADYRSSSNVSWTVAKITGQNRRPDPGLSGISVLSKENSAYFDITTFNHDDLDYAFNQVMLIHTKDSLQFDCRFLDSASKGGYLMSASPIEPGEETTSVLFQQPSNYVRIQAEQTEASQSSIIINALILKNSKPGILYHSTGINGAHFSNYNNSPLFFKQMRVLKPDLIIISLGTNEGTDIKVTVDKVVTSVTTMIKKIKSANPETCILITTPADDYFRKKYENPYLEAVHRALLQSADQEHVACWDMYSVTGGFGSSSEWRKADMMQSDGIHFNKPGYTIQGTLLYKALIDSYLKYATD